MSSKRARAVAERGGRFLGLVKRQDRCFDVVAAGVGEHRRLPAAHDDRVEPV